MLKYDSSFSESGAVVRENSVAQFRYEIRKMGSIRMRGGRNDTDVEGVALREICATVRRKLSERNTSLVDLKFIFYPDDIKVISFQIFNFKINYSKDRIIIKRTINERIII